MLGVFSPVLGPLRSALGNSRTNNARLPCVSWVIRETLRHLVSVLGDSRGPQKHLKSAGEPAVRPIRPYRYYAARLRSLPGPSVCKTTFSRSQASRDDPNPSARLTAFQVSVAKASPLDAPLCLFRISNSRVCLRKAPPPHMILMLEELPDLSQA